jgi:peptidyl-prolyl cis-trans isomerase C
VNSSLSVIGRNPSARASFRLKLRAETADYALALHISRFVRPAWLIALVALLGACESNTKETPTAPAGSVVSRRDLPEERAKAVLAKVGDRQITLGDYVTALERMDRFERLRYQTPERRKVLLDEMIDVELLAREAERLGIDKEPETRAILQQLLREEVLRELRDKAPKAEEIPEAEVSSYYAAHPEEFDDPERRRVAVIALADANAGKEVLAAVSEADPKRWGEVARQRSLLPSPPKGSADAARPPLELEGDLGLTSGPGQVRGQNPKVPNEVRDAVFRIDAQGAVYPELVASGGRFYVVRLLSKSPARKRSLEEADTVIRARLVQERISKAEAELQAELARKYPVQIDEEALASIQVPQGGPGREPALAPTASAQPSGSAAPSPSGTAP